MNAVDAPRYVESLPTVTRPIVLTALRKQRLRELAAVVGTGALGLAALVLLVVGLVIL